MAAAGIVAIVFGCSGPKSQAPVAEIALPPPVEARAATSDADTSAALSLLNDRSLPPETVAGLIEKMAAEHPGSAGIQEALGQLRERENEDEKAIAAYRRAVELDPSRARAWLQLGILLKRNGRDLQGAITAFHKALETGAPRPQTLNELGVAHAYRSELDKALAVWDQAIREDPSWGVLYANALKGALHFKDVERAGAYYEKGKSIAHPEENLPLQWGEYLADNGREREAAQVYDEAVARFPESARLAYYRGQALRQVGQSDRAREELRRAITIDPDGPKGQVATWSNRALFILEYPKEEAEFQKCVKDYFEAIKEQGDAKEKELAEIQPRVQALVDQHPEFWNAWSLLAWIDRRLGRYDDAHHCLEQVLEIYPNEPNALHEMGLLLREQNRLEEAHRHLLDAQRLAPRDPTVLMNLTLTEIDLGLWDQAKKRIQDVEDRYGAESAAALRDYYTERRSGKESRPGERPEVPIGKLSE